MNFIMRLVAVLALGCLPIAARAEGLHNAAMLHNGQMMIVAPSGQVTLLPTPNKPVSDLLMGDGTPMATDMVIMKQCDHIYFMQVQSATASEDDSK